MSYYLYSTGSLDLYLTTSSEYPRVTINKNYNSTNLISTYITNQSSPWIFVPTLSSDLEQYSVTINNNAETDI